ncbi:GGDEF domain-containing protein [Lysobacter sp. CA199]|uniref:GGDEF domain-containing protein n=1 Tax=Lysobacter sp. CA199 TaxID=3455608 RepID=UPI003F8D3D7C
MGADSLLHAREADRLAALYSLRVLDAAPIQELDAVARMAARLCGAPYGSVSVIDRDMHRTIASFGSPPMDAPRSVSLCARAILDGALVHSADVQVDPRFADMPVLKLIQPPIRMFVAAPLTTRDGLPIGTIRVYDEVVRELGERERAGLTDLAALVMRLLELRSATDDLHRLATHDALTGLPNRRVFSALPIEQQPADRLLACVDLDGFKTINDRGGHTVGDEVLRAIARRLRGAVENDGLAVRMGGDEFVLWLPAPHGEPALLERLLALFDAPVAIDGREWSVGATIGMSRREPDEDWPQWIARTDRLMYRRKRGSDQAM